MPEPDYNAAYGAKFPTNYVRIQDTDMTFTPMGGGAPLTLPLQPKAIIEDFDPDYGRMNAILGIEVPHTNTPTRRRSS